ncbi:unnamed protein product [Camellia sinensis]
MKTRSRARSSSNPFEIFEFSKAEEQVEIASKTMSQKFKIHHSDSSPVNKYKFLQCFAKGAKTKQKDFNNEILDVDACDDAVNEVISVSDAHTNYLDPWCSFSGSNSYTARTLNHGVTYTGSRHLDSTLSRLLSDNGPVTINSDDDDGIELSSSTSACDLAENEGPLEEQLLEHRFGGCFIDTTVVVSPDYIIYGDMHINESQLTFSCCYIKVEGSSACGIKVPFSFKWTVGDIINIESQWYGQVETAVVKLHLKSKDMKAAENTNTSSGIAELRFAVFDPNWSEREEAIKSLDVRYRAKWNLVSDIDTRGESACLGNNNIFFEKHYFSTPDDSFEEVVYPKGDPDAVSISKRDIELLRPETFINDTIIDFYIKYLKNKIKPEEKNRFHFFNSFFFRKLADLDRGPSRACKGRAAFQRVHKWTRKVNLFEKDYIFIPVNFSLHWSLIVICFPGDVANIEDEDVKKLSKVPCILHMDSIKGSHRGLKNLIQSYLLEEWKERQNQLLEDVSSKFLNLRFVPLELPQQENSFDCGLFLLHYVELFLDRAPVDFSPFKITKFSNFLNKDWFPPAEVSLKRAHIKKLIYEIVEDNSQKAPPAPRSDDKVPSSELPGMDEKDTGVEILQERFNSPEICHSNYSSSVADQEIEITPLVATPLRCVQSSKEQHSIFRDRSNQSFGQMVSLDQSKNVMSPIEECEETLEQFPYTPTDKAGCQRLAEVTEPFMHAYSAKEISSLETSSSSVVSLHPDESELGDSFSGTSIGGSLISSEVEVNDSLSQEFLGSNPARENDKPESPSTSNDQFATYIIEDSEEEDGTACVVEDSQEEDETLDVNDTEKFTFQLGKILGSSNQEASATENIVVRGNNIRPMSESEEQVAAKRPRLMTPEGGRRRR